MHSVTQKQYISVYEDETNDCQKYKQNTESLNVYEHERQLESAERNNLYLTKVSEVIHVKRLNS